jgi:hypothetical protein
MKCSLRPYVTWSDKPKRFGRLGSHIQRCTGAPLHNAQIVPDQTLLNTAHDAITHSLPKHLDP